MSDQFPSDQPSSPNDQTTPLTDDQLDAVTGGILEDGGPNYGCKSCDFLYDTDAQWATHKNFFPTHIR